MSSALLGTGDGEDSSGPSARASGSSRSGSSSSGDSSASIDSGRSSRSSGYNALRSGKDDDADQDELSKRKDVIPTTITVNAPLAPPAVSTDTTISQLPPEITSPSERLPHKRKSKKRHNIHVPFQYPYQNFRTHRQRISVNARRFKRRKISREAKTHALMQMLAPLQGEQRIDAIKRAILEKGGADFPGFPSGMLSSSSEEEDSKEANAKLSLERWEENNEFVGDVDYRRDWIAEGRGWRGRRPLFETIPVGEISNLVGWATNHSEDREKDTLDNKRNKEKIHQYAAASSKPSNTIDFAIPCQQSLLHQPAPPPPPSNLTFLAECTAAKLSSNVQHIKKIAFERECASLSSSHLHRNNDEDAQAPVKKPTKHKERLSTDEVMKTARLRSMYRAFDDTALVAFGMATEEVLTSALMPLARAHVARCRMLERREQWRGEKSDKLNHERGDKQGSGAAKEKVLLSGSSSKKQQIQNSSVEQKIGKGQLIPSDERNISATSLDLRRVDESSCVNKNSDSVSILVEKRNTLNDTSKGHDCESHRIDTNPDKNQQHIQVADDTQPQKVLKMPGEENENPFEAWTLPPTEALVGLVPFRSALLEKQKVRTENKLDANGHDQKLESALPYLPSSLQPSVPYDRSTETSTPKNVSDMTDKGDITSLNDERHQSQSESDLNKFSSSLRWCKRHKLKTNFVSRNMELYGIFLQTPPREKSAVDCLSLSQKSSLLDKPISRS